MNKLILKKLILNNKEISFNDHLNYIVGGNATGKTTLFKLIRYIFGLELNIPEYISLKLEVLKLHCIIGDKNIKVNRDLESNYIFFKGDIEEKVKVNSKKYVRILDDIFNPSFNIDKDDKSSKDILNLCFLNEDFLLYTKNNINIVKKILGLNVDLLQKSKLEIENFYQQTKYKKISSELIKQYIENVKDILYTDYKNKIGEQELELIENVLNEKYIDIQDTYIKENEFLNDAKYAYEKLKNKIDTSYNEKINNLEKEFYILQNKLNLNRHVKLNEVLSFDNINKFSYGKIMSLQLLVILLFTQRSNKNIINPLPIIITDTIFNPIEERMLYKTLDLMFELSQKNNVQYIHFVSLNDKILSNNIILDLDKQEGFFNVNFPN